MSKGGFVREGEEERRKEKKKRKKEERRKEKGEEGMISGGKRKGIRGRAAKAIDSISPTTYS